MPSTSQDGSGTNITSSTAKSPPFLPRRQRSQIDFIPRQVVRHGSGGLPRSQPQQDIALSNHTELTDTTESASPQSPANSVVLPFKPRSSSSHPTRRWSEQSQDGEDNVISSLGSSNSNKQLGIVPQPMPSTPIQLDHLRNVRSTNILTEHRINAFLHDYHDDFTSMANTNQANHTSWECFFNEYCMDDYQHIRPSGNSINKQGFIDMFTHEADIEFCTLVSVDSIRILRGHLSAVVVYTGDQAFSYQGTINRDRVVFSSVVQVDMLDGSIKFVHEHRTSGRPIPSIGRWDTSEDPTTGTEPPLTIKNTSDDEPPLS